MSPTLLMFRYKYCEYGAEVLEIKGLVVGVYKYVFLEYFVSSYLFKATNNKFKEVMWRVFYRNEGLVVFGGGSTTEIK